MTDAQIRLYRRETSLWRAARKARGLKTRDEDRHALHLKVLGKDKSSLALTNGEFDLILGAFRAESKPDDLNAQLRQLDQGDQRKSKLMARVRELAGSVGIKPFAEGGYLDGMARRIFKTDQYHELNELQLGQLCGILEQRIKQIEKKAGVAANINNAEPF
jgi:hypothetical protein